MASHDNDHCSSCTVHLTRSHSGVKDPGQNCESGGTDFASGVQTPGSLTALYVLAVRGSFCLGY